MEVTSEEKKLKNKILIIFLIIIFNILAVYSVGKSMMIGNSEYEKAITVARNYSENNLCSKAIDAYKEVVKIEDTIEARTEMIKVYEKGVKNGEFTNTYEVTNMVFDIVDDHRDENEAYEYAGEFFYNTSNFEDCVIVLKQAEKRKIKSKKIEELVEKVKYKYEISYSMYVDVFKGNEDKYTVVEGDTYGFLDETAASVVGSGYDFASIFSENRAFVKKEGYTFLINSEGQREAYFSNDIEKSSGVGSNLLACVENGKYKYYGTDGKYKFGEYEYAGKFRNNIAAVKENQKWKLIDDKGKTICNEEFEDIKQNELEECSAQGIIFAKENETYKMYDLKMKRIGKQEFEDVRPFIDEEGYAAVKINGKWGYINIKGDIEIEPEYEDAKSFSNGIGSVKKGPYWVMIDSKNKDIIEGEFEDIDYMNSEGICFVKTNGYWKSISMLYWE